VWPVRAALCNGVSPFSSLLKTNSGLLLSIALISAKSPCCAADRNSRLWSRLHEKMLLQAKATRTIEAQREMGTRQTKLRKVCILSTIISTDVERQPEKFHFDSNILRGEW
jgi:hypothetical protein